MTFSSLWIACGLGSHAEMGHWQYAWPVQGAASPLTISQGDEP